VINDPKIAERIATRVRTTLPQANLVTDFQTTVSEDMAFMMEKVPGCYLMIGGANPALGLDFPHHHPRFDFDETALVWASATLSTAALELLK
jgi:metal-dependent amidase/aminoacylase/carboxypeptidase family protein